MEYLVPQVLLTEHAEIRAGLDRAIAMGGRVGQVATNVAQALYPHMEKEEKCALRPLSVLPLLAKGQVTPNMSGVLTMVAKLKSALPELLEDHRAIEVALGGLTDVAKAEENGEFTSLAKQLALHLQCEEQILYPTAILIGRYVELDFGDAPVEWEAQDA